jgi:hypothetical protein
MLRDAWRVAIKALHRGGFGNVLEDVLGLDILSP